MFPLVTFNQLLKKRERERKTCSVEVFIKKLETRVWSAFVGQFPIALRLLHKHPSLTGAGIQRHRKKKICMSQRGDLRLLLKVCGAAPRCQQKAGQQDKPQEAPNGQSSYRI